MILLLRRRRALKTLPEKAEPTKAWSLELTED